LSLVGGVQDARRADDADERCHRPADARPHQVHILEQRAHLGDQRKLLLHVEPLDHAIRQVQLLGRHFGLGDHLL
jgi:hypothetical protein